MKNAEIYQSNASFQCRVPTIFRGGMLQTNAYLLHCHDGNLLIDAPEGSYQFCESQSSINALFLTHGHFDHVIDAAKIIRKYNCPVFTHPITEIIIADNQALKKFGIDLEVEPIRNSNFSLEGDFKILGENFYLYELPGHCPGSLGLYDQKNHTLYGGDVLFKGGVGRWDIPGGDENTLLSTIKNKILLLPPETIVYPGHGSSTTIEFEKKMNPYLNEYRSAQ